MKSFTIFLISILICSLSSKVYDDFFSEDEEVQLTFEEELKLYQNYLIKYGSTWLINFESSEISLENRAYVFVSNLRKIIQHNKNPAKFYTKGINQFTGLTDFEKKNYILRDAQNCSATAQETLKNKKLKSFSTPIPATQDWRTKGVVSEVKNQGNCGSCWTFSTTGCLESHWSLKTGQAPPLLSEQQLVDCAGNFNNFGCNGGLPAQAFEYIRYNGGLNSESSYPYEGKDGTCRFKKSAIVASVPGGSVNITAYDEQQILQAVGSVGPVSMAFDVSDDFMGYSGGVFVDSTCFQDPEHVNHAVLIVGYGNENQQDYWIVKNSWGSSWGEDGYFRILRGKNVCGLATCASYPNVFG